MHQEIKARTEPTRASREAAASERNLPACRVTRHGGVPTSGRVALVAPERSAVGTIGVIYDEVDGPNF